MTQAILVLVAAVAAIPAVHSTSLLVPPGHVIVGRVVDGEWTVAAFAPHDVPPPPASVGAEPAYDCMHDRVGIDQWLPLSANLAYPAVANLASAGFCDGGDGLAGPVTYLAFSDTGDAGGRILLLDSASTGYYEIACQHHSTGDPPSSAAATGVGVGPEWRVLHDGTYTSCVFSTTGPLPSEFKAPFGSVYNGNRRYGVTYASFVVGAGA